MLRTLREIVRVSATLDGLGPDEEEERYQRARVLYQRRVVEPAEPVSRGQTARYDERTAAMISVYLQLAEVGVAIPDSRSFFSRGRTDPRPGVVQRGGQFDAALEGIVAGEAWELRIEWCRHRETGERLLRGGFRRADESVNSLARQILDAQAATRATVIVPLNNVALPFLAADDDEV